MRKFFYVLYEVLVFTPLFAIATIITAMTVIIGCLIGNKDYWGCVPPRYWSKFGCRLALCSIKIINEAELDPEQSYIFIPNHQSYVDIFLMYGYLGQNIKWVQKQTLRKIPFVGKACEVAGHVYVDQSSIKSMKETIAKAEEQLRMGKASITIFPEGARTRTGKMGKFKKGGFIIAKDMNLPVVPITLNGPFDVMRRGSLFLHLGKKLELIVHKPIPTKNLSKENLSELLNQCQETIYNSLWDKYK